MSDIYGDSPTLPIYPPAPPRGWWARLNPAPRALLILGGALGIVILGCCGPLMLLGLLPGGTAPSGPDRTTEAEPTRGAYLSTADTEANEHVSAPSTLPVPTATESTPAPAPTTAQTTSSIRASTKTTTAKPPTKTTTTTSASKCHPSYTGACVPFAEDVDCYGGGGNGPAYVKGPVYVVGEDVYDLDRDGDGVACDN